MELEEEDDDELVIDDESIDEEDRLDVAVEVCVFEAADENRLDVVVEVWVFEAVDEDWCVVTIVVVKVEDTVAENKGIVWDESVEVEVVEGKAWDSKDVDGVQTGIPLLVVQNWLTSQQNETSAFAQTIEHRFSWSRSWFDWGTFSQNAARSQRTARWRELPKGRGVAAASTIVPAPAPSGLRLTMQSEDFVSCVSGFGILRLPIRPVTLASPNTEPPCCLRTFGAHGLSDLAPEDGS